MVSALVLAAVFMTTAMDSSSLLAAPSWAPAATSSDVAGAPPPIAREFRGVWIAAVGNIDWPSRRGLPTSEQQAELIAILDRAVELNLNAIILQVRPSGDALYASQLEPWSAFLTGQMGVAPEPFYDPLAFAVEEAHKRGLELHAWFNPYRARHPSDAGPASARHISLRKPKLVKRYGPFQWMDPGEPEVLAHTKAVILDVVRRYDVDGVHIDDYFYPYQERDQRGRLIPFPDDQSYQRYRKAGGRLSRADWRRDNVDRLVRELYFAIQTEKPGVKFGVSPFGIWRPGNPAGVRGLDAYAEIYADALKWLRNGWLDYIAPQLYWRADAPFQPFDRLLAWWTEQNAHDRHVWPGLFTSKSAPIETNSRWRATELLHQVGLTREQPAATGHIHFSMRALMQNVDSIGDRLRAVYAQPALIPAPRNGGGAVVATPHAELTQEPVTGRWSVSFASGDGSPVWLWTVRVRYRNEWQQFVLPGRLNSHVLTGIPGEAVPDEVLVGAVDRSSRESATVHLSLPKYRPLAELAED